MKSAFLFFVILFTSVISYAQEETDSLSAPMDSATQVVKTGEEEPEEYKEFAGSNDTTRVVEKSFDSETLRKLKNDPELNYKQPPTVAENLWTRFKRWLADLFESLFKGAITTSWGRVVLIVIGIIVVIVVVMLILKVDAFKVFYSGADQGKTEAHVFHENIHEMDFEKLIREANEKGEYRLGVRLIFLYALKTLSDKHLIEWHAGKTNHDYVNELSASELKTGLNELSFYFDYAWYGGFTITKETFQKVDSVFQSWKAKVI
ncbi:MAG: hypothetical protein DI538_02330 [Azospira oryzae]|nr:MAG: hypothetical protein DI538_02330 [Azospira oryzae]